MSTGRIRLATTDEMRAADFVPVVRVKAWRIPNEDGASRAAPILHRQWDGSWGLTPLQQPECLRCYPRCGLPMGHPSRFPKLAAGTL